jgi:cellular nucleic acid-binding protein
VVPWTPANCCWSIGAAPSAISLKPVHHLRDCATTASNPVTNRTPAHTHAPLKVCSHANTLFPSPNTFVAKQCYHCQGLGHVQADCPTLRIAGGAPTSSRCYNCGNPGHLARNCPVGGAVGAGRSMPGRVGGFRGGYANARPSATCYKCGGPNHYARDCQAQAMKCYSCGKLGHISKECPAPNGGPLSTAGKTCYTCGEPG